MRIFILGVLLLFQVTVHAQKTGQLLIDSILRGLPSMPGDSNKIKALGKISETYISVDPAKGIGYAKTGLSLSEQMGNKRGISRFENLLGLMVGDTGNNIQARVHFERSYKINKEIGYSFGMISNLSNIGRSYQRMSEYSKALEYFFRALTIAEDKKINEQIALVGTNITSSFFSQKNYAKALEYAAMTLKYGRLSNTPNNIGKALFEIGIIKQETNDSAAAEKYIDSALHIYEEINNMPAVVQVLSQKATLLFPNYRKAIVQLMKVQKILDSTGPSSLSMIGNLSSLGTASYALALQSTSPEKQKYLEQSAKWLNRGIELTKETHNPEYLANMYLALSRTEEARKNDGRALQYFKLYYSINDSLFSQDKKNELAGLETKYKVSEKDNEIAISRLNLVNQQKTLLALIVGLVLLGIIGSLLLWQNKTRKKTNIRLQDLNAKLEKANQVKLKFFGMLSHDFRTPVSNLANYLHLLKNAPDLLTETERIESRRQIGQSTEDLLQILETTLLWSKEQMENFRPNIQLIPVERLFSYLKKFFSETGHVILQFNAPGNLTISGDENYLKVIMQNLTSNAIKAVRHQPDGLIEWTAVQEAHYTQLIVRDNGPGLGDEQVKRLYNEGSDFNAGTGFGFHLIRDLAAAIKIKISVKSLPGTGTTFTLSTS
jgi:signal transduction histidine kinase/tetratricopeptide (TPR) repeat protein